MWECEYTRDCVAGMNILLKKTQKSELSLAEPVLSECETVSIF